MRALKQGREGGTKQPSVGRGSRPSLARSIIFGACVATGSVPASMIIRKALKATGIDDAEVADADPVFMAAIGT